MTSTPVVLTRRRSRLAVAAVALRPHQWTKNLLLFAGILFAGQLGDAERWTQVLVALAAYCALSSAAYLVNDVRDADVDRQHPVKRFRPVARGDLSPRRALALSAALAVVGLAFAWSLGLVSALLALAFVAGQLLYTTVLKRLYLVDVAAIAGLFVLRAAAGAVAVHVHISNWLLVCTAALALFLAFGKRRAELLAVRGARTVGRAVLERYSPRRLAVYVWATALTSVGAYVAYAVGGADSNEMAATIPFVAFGLGRYLYLMQRHDAGEEPDRVLLTDVPILVSVALWAIFAATVLNTV